MSFRASITKQSDDHKLMSNKSSLPLGMAIVSPSKQPYSSLRNRIYYNTTSKRPSGSNSRNNVSRNSDTKGNSQTYSGSTGKDNVNYRESSAQTHKKSGQERLSELDTRHRARLLRQRCKNASIDGTGMKRKAEDELEGSKSAKSRSNVKSETTSTVNWNSSKNNSHTQQDPFHDKSTRRKVILVGSESSNKTDDKQYKETLFPCEVQSETSGHGISENGINTTSTLSCVRQNLFPPEHDFKSDNVFSNDQSEMQGMKECVVDSGSDGAADFFGSLGLGSACHDRDGNGYIDSGASCSSNEQLGERPDLEDEEKDSLKNESEEMGSHQGEYEEGKTEESDSKQQALTPTKKSARISAKRAMLEQNLSSYNDDNTIWSIWGGVPSQKQKDHQHSPSEAHLPVDSPESLPEVVDVSENGSAAENRPLYSAVKIKGARMKQTPVRAKQASNNVCAPEKQVSVGSIVWGKVHGHPWWPGRVLAVSGNFGEGSETTKHAHVTWFGSNTSSIMPVNELQHFIANFKRRHKKSKRGCYRKAVRQAQDMLQIMGEEF